jgi:hypothetical protein
MWEQSVPSRKFHLHPIMKWKNWYVLKDLKVVHFKTRIIEWICEMCMFNGAINSLYSLNLVYLYPVLWNFICIYISQESHKRMKSLTFLRLISWVKMIKCLTQLLIQAWGIVSCLITKYVIFMMMLAWCFVYSY